MFSIELDLEVGRDWLRLSNSKTGNSVERRALPVFSTGDLVIGYRNELRELVKEMVTALHEQERPGLILSARGTARFCNHFPRDQEVGDLKAILNEVGFTKVTIAKS